MSIDYSRAVDRLYRTLGHPMMPFVLLAFVFLGALGLLGLVDKHVTGNALVTIPLFLMTVAGGAYATMQLLKPDTFLATLNELHFRPYVTITIDLYKVEIYGLGGYTVIPIADLAAFEHTGSSESQELRFQLVDKTSTVITRIYSDMGLGGAVPDFSMLATELNEILARFKHSSETPLPEPLPTAP